MQSMSWRRFFDLTGKRTTIRREVIAGATTFAAMSYIIVVQPTVLAVTGMDGYPMPENAGNVLLPYTSTKLSFRLPPTCDAERATKTIKRTLEADPPYGAQVEFDAEDGQSGWNAPALAPWLAESLKRASTKHFGAPVAFMGEGGSIPFMAMLGKRYPKTQFVVTGVLGPHSNAHGPNEFLHIPTGKKVSACIADVLADHAKA